MHLQSLELFGFKSFPDKTVFDFHPGVTAIVGPNGCGKSNVLDAVRWVLGEQSAKALRGGEMADVIFNGTDLRKPVGFAEVSLTFGDCSAELGVDWHEVRVTRRVYRDGISEYLLNKTVCRLRDIHALFADTGVGRSAYSIMEQGKLDQVLSSRPEDRRAVFEEAAGITKYKTQKREALRKLEATEANLLRLGDIIKEVKRQIGSLQRQAGKARRYQALLGDLQVLDAHYSYDQLERLSAEVERSRAAVAQLEEQQRTTEREIEEQENEVASERGELEQLEVRLGETRAEVQRLQNQIATARNRIDLNRERAEELAGLIERYEHDVHTAESKHAQQESEIHHTDGLIAETERLLATKNTELTNLAARAGQVRDERAQRESELQSLEMAISKAENRLGNLEEEIAGIAARRAATEPRVDELTASLGEADAERERVAAELSASRARFSDQQQALENFTTEIAAAEKAAATRLARLRDSETKLIAGDRAVAECQSRIEILRQLNAEGEGLTQGSQAVLKGLGDPVRILPALTGALASLIEVEEPFISAIEAALGRNLHAIILKDDALAAEIIAALRERKLGQTTLIAPQICAQNFTTEQGALPAGALAWATDKVHAPAELMPLVRLLLGEVLIAPDLDEARILKKQHPQLAIATLSGELISSKGVIYGGEASEEKSSVLARKAQLSALSAEHDRLVAARAESRRQQEEIQAQLSAASAEVEEIRERQQVARAEHSTTGAEVTARERELHEAERKADALNWEKITLEQQLAASAERIARLESEAAALRASLDEHHTSRSALHTAAETARLRDEQLVEQLAELRLVVATERQRHENLRSQRQPMAARQAELDELINARRTDIATYHQRLTQQATETAGAERSIAESTDALAAAEAAVAAVATTRATRLAEATALEAQLRTQRKSLSDLHDSRAKEEVRQTQTQLKMDNIAEHAMRRYQIDLRQFAPDRYAFTKTLRAQMKRRAPAAEVSPPGEESAPPINVVLASPAEDDRSTADPDEAQLAEIISDLTRQLDAMGPVNLDAVHEYDELEERHRFLETQNNDLNASRRELLDVIARINQTTEKLFAETFAQVQINFREMFAELFGGGRADLRLLDEADALNCGIDIVAKPPGKPIQAISLLSGGERTMTAVALLFAIYMVRPSPFCILDEMDAPLDESNINRFIRVLDRFVRQSQFVIITHNKRTIARSDILYGVTMEERGVSKLVGMRLTDARREETNAPAAAAQKTLNLDVTSEPEREEDLALTR